MFLRGFIHFICDETNNVLVPSITASDVEIIKPLQYASNIGSSSDMNATFSNWTIELSKWVRK